MRGRAVIRGLVLVQLGLLPAGAWAEGPPATATSTASPSEEASHTPPYGSEDVPYLTQALEEAKAAFERAIQQWNLTKEAAGAPAHERSGLALQSAERDVESLEAALRRARDAPSRRLVRIRLQYDELAGRLDSLHRSLLPEGALAKKVLRATAEVDNLLGAQAALDTEEEPSLIEARLSVLEKLDEQTRNAEELLTLAERLENRLEVEVFDAYVDYEDGVQNCVATQQALEALWEELEGSPRARTYGTTAPSPSELFRRHFAPPRTPNVADPPSPEPRRGLRPGIAQLWAAYGGNKSTRKAPSVRRYRKRLAELQQNVEQRRFVRDRLVADGERLRTLKAKEETVLPPAETAPLVQTSPSEYSHLGQRIDALEERLSDLEVEGDDLETDVSDVERELARLRAEAAGGKEDIEARARYISELRAEKVLYLGRGAPQPMLIRSFVIGERLSAARTHADFLARSIRRVEIRRDVVQRRLDGVLRERRRILNVELPRLRGAYYRTIAETVLERGVRMLLVIGLAFIALRLIRRHSESFLEKMISQTLGRQRVLEIRQQRARTVLSVGIGAIRFLVYAVTVLFVVGQLDIDYGPLLVAAGGLSLAVGFGAQSLVKDFFAGFFILLEGQYSIGDVVEIDGRSGTVEDLNLRTTVIRSVNGEVHTIPNGEIKTTTNKTKVWSRAVIDVNVDYEEDVDTVMSVLGRIGQDLLETEHWEPILRSVDVLGVESLAEHALVIRVIVETLPGKQWSAAREYQRRVKKSFDELGIEIPMREQVMAMRTPQRTRPEGRDKQRVINAFIGIHHEEEGPPAPSLEERDRAEVIAQKEAELKARADIRAEKSETYNAPTLLDHRSPLERLQGPPETPSHAENASASESSFVGRAAHLVGRAASAVRGKVEPSEPKDDGSPSPPEDAPGSKEKR